MNQSERLKDIFGAINTPDGKSICIIGCGVGESIELCLTQSIDMIVGIDSNSTNVEIAQKRFSQMQNVEITHWENVIYPRWVNKFDIVISMEDICKLEKPKQFVRDVSIITRPHASFIIICEDETSDNNISEFLYGDFMITSRIPKDDFYIIKSIKLPKKRY